MIVVKFGRWSHAALEKYTYDRIYLNEYKWTPLCKREARIHLGSKSLATGDTTIKIWGSNQGK